MIAKLGLAPGDEILLAVNGSGKTTLMEMFITFRNAAQYMERKGIKVVASHVGEMLTVQEAGGYQLMGAKIDKELKELWNAPCSTPFLSKR